ncbi:hypothetical protein INS49_008178 [Diaporthe citri]|uniref:uncharacterized protein n=1 Tax=Diaporthe citri TaxID=83186 RepID=UPI001C8193C7|nr:uncharacterized protein INS49_008178 [Diaporthe citri]KAG6363083.1 hypothetical protein INS49_008178 [Diaporthe citri]
MSILSVAGVWLIKFNFLLFFYKLGSHIARYRTWWWIGFVFNIACGAGCFGLFQYPCIFGSVEMLFVKCAAASNIRKSYIHVTFTTVLDVVSDVAGESVLCFPAHILWTVKITLRKKLLLSAVFGVVGFTIATAIVRGSMFSQFTSANGDTQMNITWITFWFYVEFTVSYLIACIVSFRSLFVRNEQQSDARDAAHMRQQSEERRRRGLKERMRMLHDSVLDTCRSLEGHWDDSNESLLRTLQVPKPPSGRLSVDFSTHAGSSFDQRVSKESSNQSQV